MEGAGVKRVCARCGITLKPNGLRIYSTFTKNYYCANVKACTKRASRRAKVPA